MKTELDLHADIIDSREIIERLAELTDSTELLDDDEASEIEVLITLDRIGRDYFSDWDCGVGLIADNYFENYAQELAEDIGATSDCASWPNYCIDWERAARELQYDYTSILIADRVYWGR